MKTLISVALCLSALSCISNNSSPIQTPSKLDATLYQPPTDLELTVSDHRAPHNHPITIIDEDAANKISSHHIEETIRKENLQLEMCNQIYQKDSKECSKLKIKICSVHMLIDTKGNHHEKPYCKK